MQIVLPIISSEDDVEKKREKEENKKEKREREKSRRDDEVNAQFRRSMTGMLSRTFHTHEQCVEQDQ